VVPQIDILSIKRNAGIHAEVAEFAILADPGHIFFGLPKPLGGAIIDPGTNLFDSLEIIDMEPAFLAFVARLKVAFFRNEKFSVEVAVPFLTRSEELHRWTHQLRAFVPSKGVGGPTDRFPIGCLLLASKDPTMGDAGASIDPIEQLGAEFNGFGEDEKDVFDPRLRNHPEKLFEGSLIEGFSS
jgi:hypothetical protein